MSYAVRAPLAIIGDRDVGLQPNSTAARRLKGTSGLSGQRITERDDMLMLAILATATLAQAAPLAWTHDVPMVQSSEAPVSQAAGQVTASYQALPRITTRQVGMSAGTRSSSVRCDWTANISVERHLRQAGKPGTSIRQLPAMKTLKGSRPGDCAANRGNINADIASRSDAINAHLASVAEQDQSALRAEIETLAPPTGR